MVVFFPLYFLLVILPTQHRLPHSTIDHSFSIHHAWSPIRPLCSSYQEGQGGSVWYSFSRRNCEFLTPSNVGQFCTNHNSSSLSGDDENRKRTQLRKLNIQKLLMKLRTSSKLEVSTTLVWEPPIGILNVKHVEREWQNVLAISDTLNLHALSSIQVSALIVPALLGISLNLCKGFLVKVKKILECICVNCGKLKADTVSEILSPLLVSHPTTPIFWGLSPSTMENPESVSLRSSRQSRCSSSRSTGFRATSVD